jgi:hypothetical protein
VIGISESRIAAGSDDAEEFPVEGTIVIDLVNLTSVDLELVRDGQTEQVVGLRFTKIAVPRGVSVTNAYIQFTVDETDGQPVTLTIQAEAVNNSATFTSTPSNISSRPRTTASVQWTPEPWRTVLVADEDQRTPNLAAVIQEVIDRPGWATNNALSIIFTQVDGRSRRTAIAYERDPEAAPLLFIEYQIGEDSPIDQRPPVVNAGENQTIAPGAIAQLNGTVEDDGLPDPPGAVTTLWSKVSGPGDVTFGDATETTTTASFSEEGRYVLRLTANDGELSGGDEVVIRVREEESNSIYFPIIGVQ